MYLHWDFKTLEKNEAKRKEGWKNEGMCFASVRQREPSVLIIFLLEFALDCPSGGWDEEYCGGSSLPMSLSALFLLLSTYFHLMQKAGIERHEARKRRWDLTYNFFTEIWMIILLFALLCKGHFLHVNAHWHVCVFTWGWSVIYSSLAWEVNILIMSSDLRHCIGSAPSRTLCTVH